MPCEMLSFCNLNLHSSQKAQWRCGAYGTHVGDLLCGLKRSLVVNKIVILLLLFKTVYNCAVQASLSRAGHQAQAFPCRTLAQAG